MTIGKALEGRIDFYDPSRNGKSKKAAAGPEWVAEAHKQHEKDEEKEKAKSSVEVILDWLRDRYRPVFRRKNQIVTHDGFAVGVTEACGIPDSRIIARLSLVPDAPRANGAVSFHKLPTHFRTWAPTAFGDLMRSLKDEDEAQLGSDTPAGEEFRRLVRDVMLSQVVLGDVVGRDGGITQTERRSLIDWCVRFGRGKRQWQRIRSYQCYTKEVLKDDGEAVLSVAIRHGLMGQMNADKRLRDVPPKKFTRRCGRYGVGQTSREERPQGEYAIVLDPDFVRELTVGLPIEPDDAFQGEPDDNQSDDRQSRQNFGVEQKGQTAPDTYAKDFIREFGG